eukprot:CAMPEP_0196594222 /NCGR_PEP_ID=MMETSP1081-20130531/77701_1 /TAXON_ID=36882 /ORGANISM="Pyramimonas amylifera, Strain CCMP720" /LENGTH=282 /DNA_ID=CAMNT_0041918425 /DNA_START=318 /DNA_END=1166 /DNA_ORIENTATION=+
MPLHWIYDTRQIKSLVKDGNPEFFNPPSCPFYRYPLGAQSPYGDEALPLLKSLVDHGGLDPQAFSQDLFAAFKAYPGRLNHASKEFLRNMQSGRGWPDCGARDDQAHCLVKAPVVAALYAGRAELRLKMEQAVRVHQNTQVAVDFGVAAALILEKVILTGSIYEALKFAGDSQDFPLSVTRPLTEALKPLASIPKGVEKFGLNCHLPGSFQGSVYGFAFGHNYTEAVRQNILAGGDNCSRASFIAACMAAQNGVDSIPISWRNQVQRYAEIEALVDKLVTSI